MMLTDRQFINTRRELCRDTGRTYIRFLPYYK